MAVSVNSCQREDVNISESVSLIDGDDDKDYELLKKFRQKIVQNSELKCLEFDDDFLAQFLYCRNNSLNDALDQLLMYVNSVQSYPDLFQWVNDIRKYLQSGVYQVLKSRSSDGGAIIVVRVKHFNPDQIDIKELIRIGILTYECSCRDPEIKRKGFHTIIDASGLNVNQIWSVGYATGKLISELTDKALPMLVKKVHVCFQNWLVDMAYGLFKPFLSDQLRQRICFHGQNSQEIFQCCPPESVPVDFGGKNTNSDWTEDELVKYYKQFRSEIEKNWIRLRMPQNNNF